MQPRFSDKAVLVTGGNSGIGRASAQAIAAEGVRSAGGKRGIPTGSLYAASKAGVSALGRNFAAELAGRGIRVNSRAPDGRAYTPR